jgi:hypothetical protein
MGAHTAVEEMRIQIEQLQPELKEQTRESDALLEKLRVDRE